MNNRTILSFLAIPTILLIVGKNDKSTNPPDVYSPLQDIPSKNLTAQPQTLYINGQDRQILEYITGKFGRYADEAIRLLNDPKCINNPELNPDKITRNMVQGHNYYLSSYIGLFQLNDYWPEIKRRPQSDLLNWRINTNLAYTIFFRDGFNFNRWDCYR